MSAEASSAIGTKERESQIRAALADLLSSRLFQASPLLARLLTFLVEEELSGRGGNLKETYVGHVIYDRPPTYDPKLDSVVRVNANRLRSRLLEYYTDHPTASPRITLRPGSYVPVYAFDSSASVLDDRIGQKRGESNLDELPLVQVEVHTLSAAVLGNSRLSSPPSGGPPDSGVETSPIPKLFAKQLPIPPTSAESKRSPRSTFGTRYWILVMLCIAAIVIIVAIRTSRRDARPAQWTAEPFSNLGGTEEFAEISPDERQLTFSWKASASEHPYIYVQPLTGQAPQRLTSSSSTSDESRPVWSPDGASIAFLRLPAPGKIEVIVKSLLSGSEQKVADLHGTYPWLCTIPRLSWTPDGKKLVTSDRVGEGEACGVVAINLATQSLQPITQPPTGTIGDLEAAVSPDGRQVAFLRNAGTLGGDIYVTSIEGGPVRRVTFDNRDVMGFCWMSNGSGVIVSSRRGDGVPRLWQVSLDGKSVKTLTDGLTLAAFPSMSRNGDRVVFTTYRTTTSIRQVAHHSEKVLISDQSGNSAPQLSPDGRSLVYRSDRTGSFEVWVSKLDGQNGIRLTDFKGPMANNPRWSPDSKQIVFECRPNGQSNVCLVALNRPMQVRLLNHWTSNEILPSWSSDGRAIYFTSNYSGRWEIYRQPVVGGGDPVAITHDGGMRVLQSGDGRWLYIYRSETPRELTRIPTPGRTDPLWGTDKPKVIWNNIASDLMGRWDLSPDGIEYLSPSTDSSQQEKLIAINADTSAHREIDTVAGPSPPGDLVFSTAADGQSFVYVKQGQREGDIGLLLLQPARH